RGGRDLVPGGFDRADPQEQGAQAAADRHYRAVIRSWAARAYRGRHHCPARKTRGWLRWLPTVRIHATGPAATAAGPVRFPYPLGGLCSLFIPWKTLGTGATGEGTPRLAGGMTVRRPFRGGRASAHRIPGPIRERSALLAGVARRPPEPPRHSWGYPAGLVGAAGHRGPRPVAVVHDRHAPVVAVAVRPGNQGLGVRVAGVDVPGGDDPRRPRNVHGHGPVVGAADVDVEVVAVVPLLARGQRRRAATATRGVAATGGVAPTGVATAAGAQRHVGGSAALVALSRHDHVVVGSEVHTVAGPRVEVVPRGDGTAGPLGLADAPVLVEGPGAFDGGRVVPRGLVDVVGTTVGGHRAHVGTGGPVGAPAFDDVVLHERVPRPPVEGQVGVTRRVEAGGVGHGPAATGGPSLTGDEVPGVPPGGAVVSARAQLHGDRSRRVGPERVEVPVVVPGLVGGHGRVGGSTGDHRDDRDECRG